MCSKHVQRPPDIDAFILCKLMKQFTHTPYQSINETEHKGVSPPRCQHDSVLRATSDTGFKGGQWPTQHNRNRSAAPTVACLSSSVFTCRLPVSWLISRIWVSARRVAAQTDQTNSWRSEATVSTRDHGRAITKLLVVSRTEKGAGLAAGYLHVTSEYKGYCELKRHLSVRPATASECHQDNLRISMFTSACC